MTHVAWLIPALPAFAAAVGFLLTRYIPGGPVVPAVAGTAGALVVACLVLADVEGDPAAIRETSTTWTPTGGVTLHVGTRVDGLAAVVAVMVCVVALLVQVYSTAYMAGDARYGTYAAEVSLFTTAMLTVVVASDLFELLIGWEVMGICSYLLIGHYWQTEGARAAAVKAFVTTRIGDTGFLFGIFVLGVGAGSFGVGAVTAHASHYPHVTIVAGTLLLLAGVVGKSAQFPLHVWLPDAMAGPTPISALIHAATMVAAGVYVVARLYPDFLAAPATMTVLAVIACVTMLGAALVALVEDDLKRVLAWSTVSQLAYMCGGLAVGGWTAGVYHLLTHAGFKTLLFLAAGSVLRTVGTNLMSEMGGLWRRMPWTFGTAVVGAAALAGIPPFAGAFSKDSVLAAAHERGGAVGTAVYVVGLVTVFVTAAYVTRMMLRTFLGDYRGAAQLHESPLVMTAPLVMLAVFALALGGPALPHGSGVARWLDPPAASRAFHVTVAGVLLTGAIALAGVVVVVLLHRRDPVADPVRVLGRAARPLGRAFYVDDIYDRALVRPLTASARAVVAIDRVAVDGAVVTTGRGTGAAGGALRLVQGGNVQGYLSGLLLGVLVIVVSVAVLA
jgi:NADH-quinone oxidoreductase subunit L